MSMIRILIARLSPGNCSNSLNRSPGGKLSAQVEFGRYSEIKSQIGGGEGIPVLPASLAGRE